MAQDPEPLDKFATATSSLHASTAGYAVWRWDGTKWSKVKDVSSSGFKADTGPVQPGRFKGQMVRSVSVIWEE